jgi:hypothetical protein
MPTVPSSMGATERHKRGAASLSQVQIAVLEHTAQVRKTTFEIRAAS